MSKIPDYPWNGDEYLNKITLAAVKAITKLEPDITNSYLTQRVVEDLRARLTIANPRCRIDDITAKAKDGYDIPLRVFTPLDVDFSLKSGLRVNEDYRGTMIFFHGGGWANGDVDFYGDACMRTALTLERRIISVNYRRSPEFRFPIGLEDCFEVTRQVFKGELLEDVDPDRIVLFGDSAGGNLAASVSLLARDTGAFTPRNQILLYPLVYNDHSETTVFDSVRDNGNDYLLTRRDIEGYVNMYISRPEDLFSPYFAPLLSLNLSDQPRTLVITAEYDPLRDEGETYAARLEADGNEVECVRMIDGIHGYFLYPKVISLVRDTYSIISRFLDGTKIEQEEPARWLELLGTN